MKPVEQLQLPLWEMLQEAAIAPDEADLRQLLDRLDESLTELDTVRSRPYDPKHVITT